MVIRSISFSGNKGGGGVWIGLHDIGTRSETHQKGARIPQPFLQSSPLCPPLPPSKQPATSLLPLHPRPPRPRFKRRIHPKRRPIILKLEPTPLTRLPRIAPPRTPALEHNLLHHPLALAIPGMRAALQLHVIPQHILVSEAVPGPVLAERGSESEVLVRIGSVG